MWRFLADHNFNADIIRGLLTRHPNLDIVTARGVGLERATDPALLAWAAENDRIIVSHDASTLPVFANDRIRVRKPMPGVIIMREHLPVKQAIFELSLLVSCGESTELIDHVEYLPL